MPDTNIRIVWENLADSGQITATSEAGNLNAANLRSDLKARVWRALSTKAAIACVWDRPEPVGVVVCAFNNFTAQATMHVRGFTRPDDLYPSFDTGPVECAPAPALGGFGFGAQPLGENFYKRGGASLFAYGYGGYGVVWVPGGHAVRRLEVIIDDPENPDQFIEVGRFIAGPWWSPRYNFDFGHSVTFYDSTSNTRTEAGDLRGEPMPRWRRVEFALSNMDGEDRSAMLHLLRHHGNTNPMFISLFPESADKLLEQSYQLWGKCVEGGKLSQPRYDVYAATLAVEEM